MYLGNNQLISLLIAIIAKQVSSLECKSYPSQKNKNIPTEYINDNYCDCPYTGEDEPNTSACSGSIGWSSIDFDDEEIEINFKCKGQNLVLPASKVNDGICDCCSGNDEDKDGLCVDICEEVLAEERRLKHELKESFDIGYIKNQESEREYKEFVDDTFNEVEDLQLKINDINADVAEKSKDYKDDIRQWRVGRRRILEQSVVSDEYSWILSLTPQEAKSLILGLCQLSGEWWYTLPKVTDVDNEDKTCIPLHLAAFDLAYMFEMNNNGNDSDIDADADADADADTAEFIPWKKPSNDNDNLNLPKLLLEFELGYTYGNEKATTSNMPDDNNDNDNDNEHHDDYEDDEDDYLDDGYYEDTELDDDDDEDTAYHHRKRRERHQRKKQQHSDRDIDNYDIDQSSIGDDGQQLVLSRLEFEMEAKKILTMIQAIFDTPDEADDDNSDSDGDSPHDENEPIDNENQENEEQILHEENEEERIAQEKIIKAAKQKVIVQNMPDNIDTIQLQKVQKDIKTYLKHISIGKNYLKSANIMIDSLFVITDDGNTIKNDYLTNDEFLFPCLLLCTLYHSRLSSIDLYTILYNIIPEIKSQQQQPDDNICDTTSSLPYVERNLKSGNGKIFTVSIPSNKVLQSTTKYCEERMNVISSSCDNNEQQSIKVDNVIIPYNVHDGCINNYFPTTYYKNDDDDDNILPSFQIINSKVSTSKQTNIDILHQEINSLRDEIKEKEKSLTSDKYGSHGELYAFKDDGCFERQANQYTYEVCMLGNSYQKEGTSKTSLGKFDSFKIEQNIVDSKTKTTMAVFFKDGQRCWQGQNRKSKVNILCGSSLGELISTEEPEVCSYEFVFKSFIACTDDYARENGFLINEECTMDDDGNKECSSFA